MNRRSFLTGPVATLTAAAAADLLLGERKIFLPPRGGWLTGKRRTICYDSALDGDCPPFGLAPIKAEGTSIYLRRNDPFYVGLVRIVDGMPVIEWKPLYGV